MAKPEEVVVGSEWLLDLPKTHGSPSQSRVRVRYPIQHNDYDDVDYVYVTFVTALNMLFAVDITRLNRAPCLTCDDTSIITKHPIGMTISWREPCPDCQDS